MFIIYYIYIISYLEQLIHHFFSDFIVACVFSRWNVCSRFYALRRMEATLKSHRAAMTRQIICMTTSHQLASNDAEVGRL